VAEQLVASQGRHGVSSSVTTVSINNSLSIKYYIGLLYRGTIKAMIMNSYVMTLESSGESDIVILVVFRISGHNNSFLLPVSC
jgi:hypothetical protein